MSTHSLLWLYTVALLYDPQAVHGTLVVKRWMHDSRIENFTTETDLLFQLDNVSKAACATKCTESTKCMSFFYTKPSRSCRLHSNRFPKGALISSTVRTSGTAFYTDACNNGYFVYDIGTDKYLGVPNVAEQSKTEAQKTCELKGATLARINSFKELEAVKKLFESKKLNTDGIPELDNYKLEGLWLDAEFNQNTGKVTWSDGSEMDVSVQLMWNGGYPTFENYSFCLTLLLPPMFSYKLHMGTCSVLHPVMVPLCECIP